MKSTRNVARIAILGAVVAAAAALAPMSRASAATLNGDWAPFTRCPVDDAKMLAADGKTDIALCVASDSPNGTIKLGNTTATTGDSNLQFGVLQSSGPTYTIVAPSGGVITGEPTDIPGGLLGLMCPGNIPVITDICNKITNSDLNRVTATVQPAGAPSNFDLSAGLTTGKPILTLPVKIRLKNPFLAPTCTIGSDSEPIVLHPQNLSAPTIRAERFNGDGTPNPTGVMNRIGLTGNSMGDSSFAVPGAHNCGLAGLLDAAVNLKTGLPSAAGNNNLVLSNASTYVAGLATPSAAAPDDGKKLSEYWHSAAQQ